jgi:glycine cleavage system aminomethyltransferase T
MDPSKPVVRLDGSEKFFESAAALDKELVRKVQEASADPAELSRLLSDLRADKEESEVLKRPMSEVKREKIKDVTRMDYAQRLGGEEPQKPLLRKSSVCLGLDCEFVEMYGQAVPSAVSSTMSEYQEAKTGAIIFDESYRQLVTLRGQDALFVIDHFATAAIRSLNVGDAIDTCIVDSKGYVLTTAVVFRSDTWDYSILLHGNSKDRIFRYLSQYVVYSRQSGLEVSLEPVDSEVVSLFGPKVSEILLHALIIEGQTTISFPDISYLPHMPAMSFVKIGKGCTVIKHYDHFLVITGPNGSDFFFKDIKKKFTLGGVYALDMLRMETGTVRPDVDCPSASTSPVKASLAHLVDQKKVREQILFGHQRISAELLRGCSHKRVALVASKYVYGGCKILSAPHRHVIGETTSCAWNVKLKKRVCQAYVKAEFAVAGNAVFVNLPLEVPESLEHRFKRRIVRQGAFRTVFRKLVPANIVSFNFLAS